MKRSSTTENESKMKKGSIKWDEENLELNEKIKQELNPRKIDEPKTPYHASPRGTDDEADLLDRSGMSPLSLGDSGGAGPVSIVTTHQTGSRSAWSDSSVGSPSPHGNGRSVSRSPRFQDDDYYGVHGDSDEDSEHLERRQKFNEARKSHYKMKEALQRAKQLLSEEETEGKEQPNGEYMDVDGHGANGTMFVLE